MENRQRWLVSVASLARLSLTWCLLQLKWTSCSTLAGLSAHFYSAPYPFLRHGNFFGALILEVLILSSLDLEMPGSLHLTASAFLGSTSLKMRTFNCTLTLN